MISIAGTPERAGLDAALEKPEDGARQRGTAGRAACGAGAGGSSALGAQGRVPSRSRACGVPWWGAVVHSMAWRLLPAPPVPRMATMSEIVLGRIFNVHKIETILRVEIRDSLCS